jgi:hypothetical protein
VASHAAVQKLRRLLPHAPIALATALLAWFSIRAVLEQTGGEPAVPLDDTFIHFQYARAFSKLEGFTYTPGSVPVPGATSLLWPLFLAPFLAIGLEGSSLVWVAWTFGFVSLGLLAHETRRAAERITSREMGIASAAMVLAFGGYTWFAGSGMEVVPLALVLMRTARRASEWAEASGSDSPAPDFSRRRARVELCALGLLAPALRPEGMLASLLAAAALGGFARRRHRLWALVPLLGPLLPPLVNGLFTGQPTSTTVLVKWLPASPYQEGLRLWQNIGANLGTLFGTLLDGRVWSAIFLPSGGRVIAWLALPALVLAGFRRGVQFRAFALLAVGLGMLIPASYDSFLWNRLRYLWPFAAAWFVGLAALADAVGDFCARFKPELGSSRLLVAGGFVGALAGHLSYAIDDLAVSADAIRRQQVDLGRWARDALPAGAVIGVNDTGAIAYFSERRTFDVCGLTTAGEARYWAAGSGSRFEHYERMQRADLPTHFIVYPDWLNLAPVLGAFLGERHVPGASILGGSTMVAHEADWSALGSGSAPLDGKELGAPRDTLDVADIESESEHAYYLFWATQQDNFILQDIEGRVDGARGSRTLDRFMMDIEPGGTLLARLGSETPLEVAVRVAGRSVGKYALMSEDWQEQRLTLPADLPRGRQWVEVEPPAGSVFSSLHYWSFGR